MPAKNSRKEYLENGYYHIYNRGVEKRTIFMDEQDYSVFLSYLKAYLSLKDEENLVKGLANPKTSLEEKDKILKLLRLNNFNKEINLIAYCLMPNHFHFLIKQNHAESIDKFMNSLATRYTMYFNKKHKRVGPLYQNVYKAVLVETDEQLLHLSRYIHKQALSNTDHPLQGHALQKVRQPSSYLDYVEKTKTDWIKTEEVLPFFSKTNPKLSYEAFVKEEDYLELIHPLLLEEN
ncbi:MAG: transposase [bacterium]|nr:transposase [bacterium]